jgi:uncharacterized membrane protein YphA (DoxX/SURF4 family)
MDYAIPTAPAPSITSATQNSRAFARHAATLARLLMGVVFFVFGLNGFFNFIPPPPAPMSEGAMSLGAALMNSGYLFQLIKGTEVLAGTLLLANRFVPLALTLLAPVIVNIFAFHAFLAPDGMVLAGLIVALEIYLAWSWRQAFRPMLGMRVRPS